MREIVIKIHNVFVADTDLIITNRLLMIFIKGASIGVLIVILVVAVAAVVVPVVIVQVNKMNANKSAADEFEGFDEDEAAKQRKMITQSTLPSAQMEHELQATA
jgi:uncharacterized protein HemX